MESHFIRRRGIDQTVNLVDFIIPDHIPDGGIHRHDFKYRSGEPSTVITSC